MQKLPMRDFSYNLWQNTCRSIDEPAGSVVAKLRNPGLVAFTLKLEHADSWHEFLSATVRTFYYRHSSASVLAVLAKEDNEESALINIVLSA